MERDTSRDLDRNIRIPGKTQADDYAAELDELILQRFPPKKKTAAKTGKKEQVNPDVSTLLEALYKNEPEKLAVQGRNSVAAVQPESIELPVRHKIAETGEQTPERKRRSVGSIVFDVFFYGALIVVVVVAYLFSTNKSPEKSVMGYRVYSIQTSSMADVYPPGTLVLVKMRDAKQQINVGDDITFYSSANAVVTHRVTEILHNYGSTGMTAYRTKGVNNQTEDAEPALEPNVVGKVVLGFKGLGALLEWAMERIWLVILLAALPFLIIALVRFGTNGNRMRRSRPL